jgi:ABC-type transporter Mla maintaining outer membrane lipid asymmetry ATPase subunit MlaF
METNPSAPAIDLRGLHKQFGPQTVLDDVSLSVAQGETLAVLGRSGVGKSVLLKLIIGLQRPDAGKLPSTDRASGIARR